MRYSFEEIQLLLKQNNSKYSLITNSQYYYVLSDRIEFVCLCGEIVRKKISEAIVNKSHIGCSVKEEVLVYCEYCNKKFYTYKKVGRKNKYCSYTCRMKARPCRNK